MSTVWRKKAISAIAESRKGKAAANSVVVKPKSGSMMADKCVEKCNNEPRAHDHKFGKKPVATLIA